MTPTVTIRITDTERANLTAAASHAGLSLSEYVRQRLALRDAPASDRLDDLERRLSRLEELAGL